MGTETTIKAPFGQRCMQKGTAMARCATALDCAFAFASGQSTDGDCGSGGSTGGSYVAVRTDHYTDWYNVRGNGTAEYSHTRFNGSSIEYVYVPDSNTYNHYNTTHGEYGSSHYTEQPPINEQPERIIIALEDKEKCINKLLMENGGNYINQILQHFEGES